ncbi:hypothetical protein IWT25_02225 [Secundilactobacillus pentosiphilus]|uniref:Uncharacterized protein n=1 Tax=Secundilactobacillus pentosiphilus TaxID=1714682 RepID=A0A1Z5IZB3_9LACO|nr:hypothetical protein [Secundilactobacillus pentosiphilus]GAX06878.1 hypothetical protein IWT25_02225 [Secundilactobacillus pentosiphilus]
MSNQVSALRKLSSQLNDRYRQFLVMDDAEPMGMPQEQRDYFLTQALTRHYHVTLHLRQAGEEQALMSGYLAKGPKATLLVTNASQNMTQVAHLNQIMFVERNDYR